MYKGTLQAGLVTEKGFVGVEQPSLWEVLLMALKPTEDSCVPPTYLGNSSLKMQQRMRIQKQFHPAVRSMRLCLGTAFICIPYLTMCVFAALLAIKVTPPSPPQPHPRPSGPLPAIWCWW